MSIDPKFVQLTADVLRILLQNTNPPGNVWTVCLLTKTVHTFPGILLRNIMVDPPPQRSRWGGGGGRGGGFTAARMEHSHPIALSLLCPTANPESYCDYEQGVTSGVDALVN